MSAGRCSVFGLWVVVCFLIDINHVTPQEITGPTTISTTNSTTSAVQGNGRQCSSDEIRCPASKACFQQYQACDSYDDCGNGYDESECPNPQSICQKVTGNYSAFQEACTRSTSPVAAHSSNQGVEVPSTDGTLYYIGPTVTNVVIDLIYFRTVDFAYEEFAFVELVITPFSSVTNDTLDPVILVWAASTGNINAFLLRSPIRVDPLLADSIRLTVSYVADSNPSSSNPYRPPAFLNTTSILLRFREYHDQCAEGTTGPPNLNHCLMSARNYAVLSSEAAQMGVSCEPRERVQVVYDNYQVCYEQPLPVQPWQSTLSTTMSTTTMQSSTTQTTMSTTTANPIFAPPCEEGELVCPVSFGCYDSDRVCDSYDDCGTRFDESLCSLSDEEGTVCQEVEQNATFFNILCSGVMESGGPYTSDASGGVYIFPLPEISNLYIDSITFITGQSFNLVGTLYAMFNITTTDRMGSVVNTTTLTAALSVTTKGSLVHDLNLRAPFPVPYFETDSIEVSILRTSQAIPPSPLNPYEDIPVSFSAIRMNFVQYYDRCASAVSDDTGQTADSECLRAAWDFRKVAERASSMGLTCIPPERTYFMSNLYDDCFEAPSIVQITGNLTVPPGQVVQLVCVAIGTPAPMVRWVVSDDVREEIQSYQNLSTGIAELTFTSTTATQLRFECVAESYVGEMRAINTVVTLGAECVEKIMARNRFQSSSDLNQSCPAVQELQSSFYSPQRRAIAYRPSSSGLLYSIDMPSQIFSFEYGNTLAALRISVTVDPYEEGPRRRRRRDVVPILHEHIAFNIAEDRNSGVYRVYFPASIPVAAYENLYIGLTSLESSQQVAPPEGPVNLRYLECPGLTDRIHNDSCYMVYRQWRGLEEELVELGCATSTSALFNLYRNCLGIADEPLRELTLTPPDVELYDNITLRCPIAGSIQSHWMKKTSREDILPFRMPSSLLRFEMFNSQDQGYYFCEGVGSENRTLATNPVLLQFKNVTTLGFSITFGRPYVDFNAPIFQQYEYSFKYRILNALMADPVLARSLVGGRYGLGGSDLPNIVNTRNGSTIVDYQASFVGANGTEDLITGVTRALIDNLRDSEEGPGDIILESITVGSVSSCPESEYAGSAGTLTFPSVGLDQIAESVEHCAIYTGNTLVPRATRTCMGDFISPSFWADPIMSECFSEDEDTNQILSDIANAPISSENVTEYSNDLVMVTNQTSSITAEGLESIATSLENIVQVQDPSEEVTVNVIHAVNNVLKVDDEDFVIAIDAEAPTRILDSLEEQVTLFQTQGDGSNLTVIDQSLAVVAVNIPKATLQEGLGFATQGGVKDDENVYNDVLFENTTMVFFNVEEILKTNFEAAIIIPSGILDALSFNGSGDDMVPVTFFVFQNSLLFQSGDQQNTLERGRRQAVGSRIISATIEGFNVQNLPAGQEIETDFLELNVTDDDVTVDARSCVFWDKTASGGEWSTEGCRREDQPGLRRIRCLCDHLTSFAVLLDVSGDINLYALDVLSMIGCGVSALCLVILLLTFLSVKKLRSRQPQRIHINLCVALLGLYIVFMFGIDFRYPTGGCVAAGVILHFFLLSSMSWMLVEAVYMYLLFVRIHSGTVSKFLRTSIVSAWGSPLIVCIILVSIDREFYLGDGSYCFVQPGPVLYYSVLLPVAIILLVNTVIFVLVTYRLTCGRWAIAANKSTDNSKKREDAWRLLQDLVAFTILLGLTWVFGFLAIGGARFVFNVLFLVFNSLQGLFVFIMFGLRQKPVRDEWLRCFRCRCRDDDRSRRSNQYMKSKPVKLLVSSAQTVSTSGSDIPLDGRGSTATASTVA